MTLNPRRAWPALLWLALTLPVACGDRSRLWNEPLALSGPHEVGQQLHWVDGTRGMLIALDPASHRSTSIAVGRNATHVVPTPAGDRLLLLTAGQEAIYHGQHVEAPALAVVAPGDPPTVERHYTLPAAFDRLTISADGTRAVAFFSADQVAADVFRNPNEVALFDLTRDQAVDNPVLRTIRAFGAAPLGVVFSQPLAIGAQPPAERVLAVVLAEGYVTLIDTSHPERSEVTVPLAKPGSAQSVRPEEVLVSSASSTLFVRASGAADLFAVQLAPRPDPAAGANDFAVTINQPSAGKTVRDALLFNDQGRDMLLTANASADLALVDAETSDAWIIALDEAVDTVVGVPPEAPRLALAYAAGKSARIHIVELADLRSGLESNVVSRSLSQSVRQLLPTPDGSRALVVHDSARTVVSLLSLAGAPYSVSPIQGQLALSSFDFVGQSHLVGVAPGLARVGLLALDNLLATSVRLDHEPHRVLAVGQRVVVDHGAPEGLVTILPGPTAEREACQVVWGFLLRDLLDHELND